MALKHRYTTQGVHIFDRTSGVNILLDEVDLHNEPLSLAPANVSIALTNLCNRQCRHCFAPKSSAVLNFEHLIGWVDELESNGCLGVGFGGGEPLLYPRIREACEYVKSHTTMACTLTTNGDFLDRATMIWMKPCVNFVRVSTNGGDVDLQRIKMLAKEFPLGINYLLNKATLPLLDVLSRRFADVGVMEMLLLPQVTTEHCEGVTKEFIQKVDEWLLLTELPLRVTVSSMCSHDMKSIVNIPGDAGVRQYLHISADGILKRTSVDETGVRIGDSGLISAIREVYAHEGLDWL